MSKSGVYSGRAFDKWNVSETGIVNTKAQKAADKYVRRGFRICAHNDVEEMSRVRHSEDLETMRMQFGVRKEEGERKVIRWVLGGYHRGHWIPTTVEEI